MSTTAVAAAGIVFLAIDIWLADWLWHNVPRRRP